MVEMLATVLHSLNLDADLDACFFQVGVGPHAHLLSSTYLSLWADEVWGLLVHCYGLIYVGLHQLILWV